jgi:hypothetical protein
VASVPQPAEARAAERAERAEKRKKYVREVTAPLFRMTYALAHFAHMAGEKHLLDTARILEGVRRCLAEPEKRDRLAKAATVLIGSESTLPSRLGEFKPAANALVDFVRETIDYHHQRGKALPDEWLAEVVDVGTSRNLYRGAQNAFPLRGSPKERQARLTEEIRKLRMFNTPGGKPLDPEAVVSAWARVCGNRREIFGAIRKSVKRSGHE